MKTQREQDAVKIYNSGITYIPIPQVMFSDEYGTTEALRPTDTHAASYTVRLTENRRLTPDDYERNVFHMEFDISVSSFAP